MGRINTLLQRLRSPRVRRVAGMLFYCAAIWLTLDFVYSYFFYQKEKFGRLGNPHYHHGLAANFDGMESWGRARTRLVTNSLGFRDMQVRNVPPVSEAKRRIVLIGDSFTEGLGIDFADTFAGLLYREGQEKSPKTEFLNAASVSYSPVIYYKKIKYLLDAGLRFDELIVFLDISDVQDEATFYFCFDDNPEYRRHCTQPPGAPSHPPTLDVAVFGTGYVPPKAGFDDRFRISADLNAHYKRVRDSVTGMRLYELTIRDRRGGWTKPGMNVGRTYEPLGVEGGIRRSLANMQALADLLKAHGIPLTVAVYPWPFQLAQNDRDSRQVRLWRDFCAANCTRFIDLFPAFFAEKDARGDWLDRLFIPGDTHFSATGHQIVFREVSRRLAEPSPAAVSEAQPRF